MHKLYSLVFLLILLKNRNYIASISWLPAQRSWHPRQCLMVSRLLFRVVSLFSWLAVLCFRNEIDSLLFSEVTATVFHKSVNVAIVLLPRGFAPDGQKVTSYDFPSTCDPIRATYGMWCYRSESRYQWNIYSFRTKAQYWVESFIHSVSICCVLSKYWALRNSKILFSKV